MHRLRLLELYGDETQALLALTRARETCRAAVALCNQLRAKLDALSPGAAHIFSEADPPISRATRARRCRCLYEKRLAGFLARYP